MKGVTDHGKGVGLDDVSTQTTLWFYDTQILYPAYTIAGYEMHEKKALHEPAMSADLHGDLLLWPNVLYTYDFYVLGPVVVSSTVTLLVLPVISVSFFNEQVNNFVTLTTFL